MTTLSSPDHDINFSLISGEEELRQRIRQHLLFFRGEWFLNASEGVPYLTDLLGERLDTDLVASVIRNQLLEVRGVTGASDMEVEEDGRRFLVRANVSTIYGEMEIGQTIAV